MNDIMQSPPAADEPAPVSAHKLVFGIVLVAVGVLAFVDAIDVVELHEVWRFWPLLLIALGVAREVDVLRTRSGDTGFILIAIGTWMLAATQHWMGLDYGSAFPIAIAVAGVGIIVHALLGIEKRKKETRS